VTNFVIGRIVQVPPGLMRNNLYGRGFAVYVTPTESEQAGSRKNVSLPDSTFGKRKAIRIEPVQDQKKALKFLSGERRLYLNQVVESELLSVRLPSIFPQIKRQEMLTGCE